MPSILFVCTANQFRSPLAVACLSKTMTRDENSANWIIESAGTWTKAGLTAPTITLRVAEQLGLPSLDQHRTPQLDQNLLKRSDLILVMEANHKEALISEFPTFSEHIYLLPELVDGISYDIPDPATLDVNSEDVG